MVYALWTSKKAHNVIQTEVSLARQDEGEEGFGSTPIARRLVRYSMNLANGISKITPESTKRWLDTRFRKEELTLEDGAAFDLVRASVNLVLSSLLIALGTSLKLPLSTTYVTFMVSMGTSLADRAWGRDSAVYRITGVLSVIGGWFITAGAAFTICFFVTMVIYFGGAVAIIALIAVAVYSLIHSQMMFKKRKQKKESLDTVRHVKQMKRTGTLAMSRLDNNTVLDKGLYYFQGNDFASELVYSVGRLVEPCLEHIDNNFKPLDAIQKGEFGDVSEDITNLLQTSRQTVEANDYNNLNDIVRKANDLNGQLAHLKRQELQRIQGQSGSIKVSMVYLTMIQEAQNVVTYTTNLLKVSRKFQAEDNSNN